MGVADLHVARHHLDKPHEVLQLRGNVIYRKRGPCDCEVAEGDAPGFSPTRGESDSAGGLTEMLRLLARDPPSRVKNCFPNKLCKC